MFKDLYHFRYYRLGENPTTLESGQETPNKDHDFINLIKRIIDGKLPRLKIGRIEIENIVSNQNLEKLNHDLYRFHALNENFFLNIKENLNLGSLAKELSANEKINFIYLVCLGIFGAESGYGNERYQQSRGQYKGPFQITDVFKEDIKEITDITIKCRNIIDGEEEPDDKISMNQAHSILENNKRYYKILTGEDIDLTTCSREIISSLSKLDRKKPEDIPKIVSLQFERTIASNHGLLEKPTIKEKFKQNPEIRKIFLLIGFQEGLLQAGKFLDFISNYRGNIQNTRKVLEAMVTLMEITGDEDDKIKKITRIINYILHSYTHQMGQENMKQKIFTIDNIPVDFETQKNMNSYKENQKKLIASPSFDTPNLLIMNKDKENEQKIELYHHIEEKIVRKRNSKGETIEEKSYVSFIELNVKSQAELTPIINPKQWNFSSGKETHQEHKETFRGLKPNTILIPAYNLIQRSTTKELRQIFKFYDISERAASKLTDEQKQVAMTQEAKEFNTSHLFQLPKRGERPREEDATQDQLRALQGQLGEKIENIPKKIAKQALQKLRIKEPTTNQINTLIEISKSINESKIELNGITINLDNIQNDDLETEPIITTTKIRFEFNDWNPNTIIHLTKDPQTGTWQRGSESYDDNTGEGPYITENKIPQTSTQIETQPSMEIKTATTEIAEITPIQEIHQNSKIINSTILRVTETMHRILKETARSKTSVVKSDFLDAYGTNKIFIINKTIFLKHIKLILTTQTNGNYKFPKSYIKTYTECMKETLNLEENEYAIPLVYIKDDVRPLEPN